MGDIKIEGHEMTNYKLENGDFVPIKKDTNIGENAFNILSKVLNNNPDLNITPVSYDKDGKYAEWAIMELYDGATVKTHKIKLEKYENIKLK